jgi:hypothetical protein
MMTIKEQIEDMLASIISGNKAEANKQFNQILASKASNAVEAAKQSAMDKQFNESESRESLSKRILSGKK